MSTVGDANPPSLRCQPAMVSSPPAIAAHATGCDGRLAVAAFAIAAALLFVARPR